MRASYGETSGFAPVAGDELTEVNGGSFTLLGILIGVAAVALSGCAQPTNSRELDGSSPTGKGR
jgi:hypothetical protein